MPLIKQDQLVEDAWVAVDDAEALPLAERIVVSLERWRAEREALTARNGRLGIRLESHQSPAEIADDLGHFGLVALVFPTFKDGRAYSSARLLRGRLGFAGELRAVGDVLRDQYLFMKRCGFDAVEVADEDALGEWREAIGEVSVVYQPAADRRPWITALRHEPRSLCLGPAEEPRAARLAC